MPAASPQTLTARLGQAVWERQHPEWTLDVPGEVRPRLHLTALGVPRYLLDRAAVRARRGRGPWLTADAQDLLERLLKPTDHVLEWGSGGTTTWFASRVARVDSVEASRDWFHALRRRLADDDVENVTVHLVPRDEFADLTKHRAAYVDVRPDLAEGSLDVVLVDAEHRDACALRALDLLRPGGLLVLDNATTYLPADTRSPWRVDQPATAGWREFVDRTADWRCVWTTNGVWDTAVWFKP